MIKFIQSWRWFGPGDPISLSDIRQTGAAGIVTALHHIPNGAVWTKTEILKRKRAIEDQKLNWVVVESVPVHEDIKKRTGSFKKYIKNYKSTIRNLGEAGIKTICYNFMPVLDWTRTDLDHKFPDGRTGLRFDMRALAAFDLFILKRDTGLHPYPARLIKEAEKYMNSLSDQGKNKLINNILAGLPGSEESYSLDQFKKILDAYEGIDKDQLRSNLSEFLEEVIPVAEKSGVYMALHPDDPPINLFGLPRVVSTSSDYEFIMSHPESDHNGMTFCAGSLAARPDNDLKEMILKFTDKIHFYHLRNIIREPNGSFYESDHLDGDVDMYQLMKVILLSNEEDREIPMRPDHGHKILDDLGKETNPGYSAIGRMRGLAELRGLESGIRNSIRL